MTKHKKEHRKFWLHHRKKKSFWISMVLVLLLVASSATFLVVRGQIKNAQGQGTDVQEATANTGDISNTIVSTGTLAAGGTTDIAVPTGITVKEVLVASGDTVTAGQQLATVDAASVASSLLTVRQNISSTQTSIDALSSEAEDSSTDAYLEKVVLEGRLADLKQAELALTALQSTGAITATCNGTVSSVNVSADTETIKSSSAGSTGSDSSSGGASNSDSSNSGSSSTPSGNTEASTSSRTEHSTQTVSSTGRSHSLSLMSTENGAIVSTAATPILITDLNALAVMAPKTGSTPQDSLNLNTSDTHYSGIISWDCDGIFQAGSTYTATILLTAENGYAFSTADNYALNINGAVVSPDTPKIIGGDNVEGNQLYIKATFQTAAETGSASGNAGSDTPDNSESQTGQTASESQGYSSSESESIAGASGSSVSNNSTGTSSTGGESSEASSYSAYETSAFKIASNDNVTVTVNVDELDILSVKKGQSATITLDALDGQDFTGTVTSVSTTASSSSSSSGNAKYPVEISIPKDDNMRIGMSASATINIEEAGAAILIPVDALQEKGDTTFVYTKKNSDGTLSGETEVETGLSNGSQVQITSGLSNGDTVYYTKISSSDGSSDSMGMNGMEKMGGMPAGDEMPSGGGNRGEMPSGERSGGGGEFNGN